MIDNNVTIYWKKFLNKLIIINMFNTEEDQILKDINSELSALIAACYSVGLDEKDEDNYKIHYGNDGRKYLTVTNLLTNEKSKRHYF